MSASRTELLRRQFELTWSLFEYHLERLEPEDFLWEPAAYCWTMHRGPDGTWVPDWADTEPDPVPVPTLMHAIADAMVVAPAKDQASLSLAPDSGDR